MERSWEGCAGGACNGHKAHSGGHRLDDGAARQAMASWSFHSILNVGQHWKTTKESNVTRVVF